MKKRIITWLLVAAGVTAIANADAYPFMPFGLFGVVGLIGVGLWLWRYPRLTGQKPPRLSWRYMVGTLVIYLVMPICMKMAINVHVSVVIQDRVLWNCCVLGVTAVLAILHVTDRQANLTVVDSLAPRRGSASTP
jgi:hypothetical protein